MRRMHKILGGMLVVGVLLTGIGSGVVFAEYSGFQYGGEVTLEGSKRFTKTIEYKVPLKKSSQKEDDAEEKQTLILAVPYDSEQIQDPEIPKDTVQFMIHYLSDQEDIAPHIVEEHEEVDYIYVSDDWKYNEFREMMRVKDPLLKALKQHKVVDIEVDRVELVEIRVNPEAEFRIEPYDGAEGYLPY